MNCNYLVVSDLQKLGFLPKDTFLRAKQGLPSQQVSSACFQNNSQNYLQPYLQNEICNQSNMYPIKLPIVNYGMKNIPKNCPCTMYVSSP
jgi:hypothetical protein